MLLCHLSLFIFSISPSVRFISFLIICSTSVPSLVDGNVFTPILDLDGTIESVLTSIFDFFFRLALHVIIFNI